MSTVVAVINQKGGVGKTTTAMNLGAALAEKKRSVLLVDLDPQGNLTSHCGVDEASLEATVYEVLLGETPLAPVLRVLPEERLYLAPSTIDLSAAEMELVGKPGRETILRDALELLKGEGEAGRAPKFDVVLIDCPPSLGLLSVNALAAADLVLIPMQAEFFALQGMAKLLDVVELVRGRLNKRLKFDGVVPCKLDRRPRLTEEVLAEINEHFPGKLYKASVRPNVKLAEATSHGRSVLAYEPASPGAEDYRAVAVEFLARNGLAAPRRAAPKPFVAPKAAVAAEPEAPAPGGGAAGA